jgi:hypothetical protein
MPRLKQLDLGWDRKKQLLIVCSETYPR